MMANKFMWDEDIALFRSMEDNYQSDREREFFEKLKHKEENVLTVSNDLLMSEYDNEDSIYIVREEFSEFVIGRDGATEEHHYMNLSETLAANLREIGLLDRDVTLFQWLRERDYKGIMYDHNYDDL